MHRVDEIWESHSDYGSSQTMQQMAIDKMWYRAVCHFLSQEELKAVSCNPELIRKYRCHTFVKCTQRGREVEILEGYEFKLPSSTKIQMRTTHERESPGQNLAENVFKTT